jgi:hypothetical protein
MERPLLEWRMMGIVILINKYTSATIMGIVIGAALGESGRDLGLFDSYLSRY